MCLYDGGSGVGGSSNLCVSMKVAVVWVGPAICECVSMVAAVRVGPAMCLCDDCSGACGSSNL